MTSAASAKCRQTINPLVWVVLVNWNGWRETCRCLSALERVDYGPLKVVVVDNASDDDSVTELRRRFPSIELVVSDANRGFAAGCNIGIRRALARRAAYVWLLNNDAVPEPTSLSALVGAAEADSGLGAVGSVFHSADGSEPPVWGGGWVDLLTGRSAHHHRPVPSDRLHYLTGASLLLRGKALEAVGSLDERFFLYFEDAELGIRLRRTGWKLGVAEGSRVFHAGGASSAKVGNRTLARYRTLSVLSLLELYSPGWPISWGVATLLRFLAFCRQGSWKQAFWVLKDSLKFVFSGSDSSG